MSSSRCHLDIESYSECDLKSAGASRYAEHESTAVLIVCWAVGDNPVRIWFPSWDIPALIETGLRVKHNPLLLYVQPNCPEELLALAADPSQLFAAHNAAFERTLLNGLPGKKIGFPPIPINRWICTAAKAAEAGLPRALGDAAAALGTAPKDGGGRLVMLQLAKPRKGKDPRYTPENAPEKFIDLALYCMDDVIAERDIDKTLPDLSEKELRAWQLDQAVNDRGVRVDLAAIADVQFLIAEYKNELEALCLQWTKIKPTQRALLADWVREHGYPGLSDMQAETIKRVTADPTCSPEAARVLQLYSTYGSKAVSKYTAMEEAVCADGRLRGMLLFYGAHTGRWSSMIVQLQNLFRSLIEDCSTAIEAFKPRSLDWIRCLYAIDPMKVFASCTRGMLVPAPEHDFLALDFSGVESRVIAWLAGEDWKLQAFRDYDAGTGPDNYKLAYARAFQIPVEDVTKEQRQIGKVMELALGYEGGVGAFTTMVSTYGVDLDDLVRSMDGKIPDDARESGEWMWNNYGAHRTPDSERERYITCDALKYLWRKSHPKIVQMWKDLKTSARLAVENPGKIYGLNNDRLRFSVRGEWLYMLLPSGRKLAYYKPQVDGEIISYMGIDTDTRRWMRTATYGGKCAEQGTQATARDLLLDAMFRLENAGYPIVLTVHDEEVSEVRKGFGSIEEASQIMCASEAWAAELPVAVAGWREDRFRK